MHIRKKCLRSPLSQPSFKPYLSHHLTTSSRLTHITTSHNKIFHNQPYYASCLYSTSSGKNTGNGEERDDTNHKSAQSSSNTRIYIFGSLVIFLTVTAASSYYIYTTYFENIVKFIPDESELNEATRKRIQEEKEMEMLAPDEIMNRLLSDIESEATDRTSWSIFTYFRLLLRTISLSLRLTPLFLFAPILWLREEYHVYWYRLLVRTLRSCGACFIKLGQWMATRPDLFPRELCLMLGQLHSSGDRHSFRQTKRILREALGRPLEEVFEEFQEHELASGAIAQIYKAKLSQSIIDELDIELDSPWVAVKVRHPQVKASLVTDLRIIRALTRFLGRFETFKYLNLEENVIVFSRNMKAQLNLRQEADNLRLFRHNFREIPQIRFPEPVEQLSSPQVLVESFEEGIPISEFTEIQDTSTRKFKEQLASLGIVLYLKMLVVDSLLHADLHPGNLFVRLQQDSDGNITPSLVVLDAGLVCALSPTDKKNFLDLFKAVTKKNGREVAELMITRSKAYKNRDLNTLNVEERERLEGFVREMEELIQDVIDLPFGEVQIGSTMSKVLDLGRKYHVPVEANFTTLVIGSIVIEGLGRQLNPTLRFVEESKPVLSQVAELRSEWIKGRFEEMFDLNKFTMEDIFKDVEKAKKWVGGVCGDEEEEKEND